jgi:hypothetical protein
MNTSQIISILDSFKLGHILDNTDMIVIDCIKDLLNKNDDDGK